MIRSIIGQFLREQKKECLDEDIFAVSFHGKKLTLLVKTTLALNELNFLSYELTKEVNTRLEKAGVPLVFSHCLFRLGNPR